jgi:4-hydroxy-3-methylbut-2-en-1-yl diphosphate reductase
LIDSYRDIHTEWMNDAQAVGITAGASAPEVLVNEVVEYLKRSGAHEVEELTVIEEDVEFLLPKELVTVKSSQPV